MGLMIGLPNTKRSLKAVTARTAQQAVKVLKAGNAAMAAGDHGSQHAWLDDAGQMRFSRCRFLQTQESVVVRRVAVLKALWKNGLAWCREGEAAVMSAHTFIEPLAYHDLFVAREASVHMHLNKRQHAAVKKHLGFNALDPYREDGTHILTVATLVASELVRFCQDRNIRVEMNITLRAWPE